MTSGRRAASGEGFELDCVEARPNLATCFVYVRIYYKCNDAIAFSELKVDTNLYTPNFCYIERWLKWGNF